MNTRSHLRIYHPAPAGKASSTVVPLSPPGPARITYAIRRAVASGSDSDAGEISVDRLGDFSKHSPTNGDGIDGDEDQDKLRQEQQALELLSPALALIHIFPTGSTFIEALPAANSVKLVRVSANRPAPINGQLGTLLPKSTNDVGVKERLLVVLDGDALFLIDDIYKLMYQNVEMSIAVPSTDRTGEENEVAGTGSGNETRASSENDEGERVEGGLATPPRLEPGKEVTVVLDTPHGRERFMDLHLKQQANVGQTQESLFEPTPQQASDLTRSESIWSEQERHSGERLAREEEAVDQEDNIGQEENMDEDEDIVPTMITKSPLESTSPLANKGSGESLPSFIGTLPPSSGGDEEEEERDNRAGSEVTPKPTSKKLSKREDSESDFPDSLPEGFRLPKTSVPKRTSITYGRGGVRNGAGKVSSPPPSSIPESSRQLPEASDSAQMSSELSPPPQASALVKGGDGVDENSSPFIPSRTIPPPPGKAAIDQGKRVIEESSQPDAPFSTAAMEIDNKEDDREHPTTDGKLDENKNNTSSESPLSDLSDSAAAMLIVPAVPTKTQRGTRKSLGSEGKTAALETPVRTPKRKRGGIKGEAEKEEAEGEDEKGQRNNTPGRNDEAHTENTKPPASKKKALNKKENKKPPKKRARKSTTSNKSEATQQSIPGSDDEGDGTEMDDASDKKTNAGDNEEEETLPLHAKTPLKRGRKSAIGPSEATPPSKHTPQKSFNSPSAKSSFTSSERPEGSKAYTGPPPKVVFSNSPLSARKDLPSILRSLGVKKAQKVTDKDVTHLVVGPGGIVRSSKLAMAITLGIPVVEDTWLTDSASCSELLDPMEGGSVGAGYVPHDTHHEAEWSFSLESAISRGKEGVLKTLLAPYTTIYITPTLLTQLKSSGQEEGFVDVLRAAGADKIVKKPPPRTGGSSGLVFGAADKEKEKDLRMWKEEGGWIVYRHEMVTMSILRGRLLVEEEEFRLTPAGAGEEKGVGSESFASTVDTADGSPPAATTPAGRGGARRKSMR